MWYTFAQATSRFLIALPPWSPGAGRPAPRRTKMADYDLRSLDLPKVTGRALRLFAGAVSNPATRNAFLPALLKQGGFAVLRALHPEEPPTFYPLGIAGLP
jgi:hypothetical protein